MINIVTGYKGVKHITSEQFADLNRSIFGNGNYILKNIGDGCNYNIVTNNEIQIQSGVFFLQGKQGEIDSGGISATIENGTQNMKRYDVICVKYTKDSVSNVENFEYETVKGTEDPNEYIIPEFDRGDIRAGDYEARAGFYGVKINGLTIEDVELFKDTELKNIINDNINLLNSRVDNLEDIKRVLLFQGAIKTGDITLNDNMYNYRFLYIKVSSGTSGYTYGGGIYPIIDPTLNNSNHKTQAFMGYEAPAEDADSTPNTVITYSGVFVNKNETTLTVFSQISNVAHQSGKNHTGGTKYYVREVIGIR